MENIFFTNVKVLESVDSTNTYVKKNHENIQDMSVVVANYQTNGRGRFDRSWEGGEKTSVLATFLIKNIGGFEKAIQSTFFFSLAVKNLIKKYIDEKKIILKWPNDVLVNKKKICGILSEHSSGHAIIGVGINILDFDNSKEIKNIHTTLQKESKHSFNIKRVRMDFINEVNNVFSKGYEFSEITNIWLKESGIFDKNVRIKENDRYINGKVKGVSELGELLLLDDTGNDIIVSTGDLELYDKF